MLHADGSIYADELAVKWDANPPKKRLMFCAIRIRFFFKTSCVTLFIPILVRLETHHRLSNYHVYQSIYYARRRLHLANNLHHIYYVVGDKKVSHDTSLHLTITLVTLIQTYTRNCCRLPRSWQFAYTETGSILDLCS